MTEVATPPPPPPPPPVLQPPASTPPTPQYDFAKPFTYVFEDPDWVTKIAIGGLFYLAGFLIIGWFFIFGYVARTTRNIISGQPRPLPEWDNLGDYFNEGLRLFGVALVYMLPLIGLAITMIFPMILADATDSEALHAIGGLGVGCISLLYVPLVLAMVFFLPATMLFTVVEQRFGAAFDFKRIWPFIKQNIGNYLLAIVVYLIARMLASVGLALLCIGVIFTGFWSFLIMAHGFAQVYRLATLPKE